MEHARRWCLLASALALALGPAAGARADRVHVVRPGETLWQIAAAATGDPLDWPALYRANRDQIKDPARLYPGQRLTIPEPISGPDDARPVAPPAAPDEGG